MSKLIALKSGSYEILDDAWNSDFSTLKQQALLFDQIGIYKLSNFYKTLQGSEDLVKKIAPTIPNRAGAIIAELEWLQQMGVIFELTVQEELQNQTMEHFAQIGGQKFEDAKNLLRKAIEIQTLDLKNVSDETSKINLIREQQLTILRLMSIVMETTRKATVVTTLPYTEYSRELSNSSKSDVVQVAINNLPLPNNETPWEQIIDYRNDLETQKHLLSLRRWISKILKQDLSPLEIEEEIESLINDFQEHMKFHRIKANTETLEVIVNSTVDVIGNLLTLKFSKILDPLFSIKKRQLSLLEAEMNAPGKEMAYIIKTKEVFQSQE
jgi:hypothetical protein